MTARVLLLSAAVAACGGTVKSKAACSADALPVGGSLHFAMGGESGEQLENTRPIQYVRFASAFKLDRTEVTVACYAGCVKDGACTPAATGGKCNAGTGSDDHPINCVDWSQADAYCRWVGGRLPTEAEWEYAAGGENGTGFPWGWAVPGADCEQAVWSGTPCNPGGTLPVGSKPLGKGPYGHLDLAGNVAEWVSDWFGPYGCASGHPQGCTDENPEVDPQGPASGQYRVARGGAWSDTNQQRLRAQDREWIDPANHDDVRGFRCVHP